MDKFKKLGLSTPIIEVLEKMGYTDPTPIQKKAIPLLLQNNPTDFIGLAHTGTGKTAAYGLPLMELVNKESHTIQALILAPTRELVQQIAQQITYYSGKIRKISVSVVYGGTDISKQIYALKSPSQILVATPGRLLDLLKRKAVHLQETSHIILDEADEMLNMGFREEIDKILAYMYGERSIWLFSATMPAGIRKIVSKYMKEPIEISIDSNNKINNDISHKYVITKTSDKIPALRRFLDHQPELRGILFCRTRRETRQIADTLRSTGYDVEALHGDLTQAQRNEVMKKFRMDSIRLLIATDVAARGLDVTDLSHIIHHTLPDQPESYTHRSGRTGRAGKKGISLAFINPREFRRIGELEKMNNVTFDRIEVPCFEDVKSIRLQHWADKVLNAAVFDHSESMIADMADKFSHLSKVDLLKRLITTQLEDLHDHGNCVDDGTPDLFTDRKQKGENGRHRYFVNVGTMDGMNESDLFSFLSEISGVDRKYFDHMTMHKNCAYFTLRDQTAIEFGKKFDGVEIEGRPIRVNRDDKNKESAKFKKKKPGISRNRKRKIKWTGQINKFS